MSATTTTSPDATPQDTEYQAIEETFTQTARGRWFLAEFARRNRNADTALVLAALEQLGERISGREVTARVESLRLALSELVEAAERDAQQAAAITHPAMEADEPLAGQDPFAAIAQLSGKATSTILDAAEQIQELAWTLRERGSDGAACDMLDQRATDIYAACSLEEVAMKRLAVLLRNVRTTGDGIAALCESWGVTDARPPAEPAQGELPEAEPRAIEDQSLLDGDLDFVFLSEPSPPAAEMAEEPDAPIAVEEPAAAPDWPAEDEAPDPERADAERRRRERIAVLAEIDGLDLREKLRRFT